MPSTAAPAGFEIDSGWRLTSTAAGAYRTPADLPAAMDWIAAPVPGTVAAALTDAGRWSLEAPTPLHDRDHWYTVAFAGDGPATLVFEGLATLAEVWLGGELLLISNSMFLAHQVDVTLAGRNRLSLCFRALEPALANAKPKPRARWRPRMIATQNLRAVRTTLIGHMPGWCPPVHAIGPWRPVRVIAKGQQRLLSSTVRCTLDGTDGCVDAQFILSPECNGPVWLSIDGHEVALRETAKECWIGRLVVPGIKPWWPHTHGTPRLYPLQLRIGSEDHSLGHTGFRHIEADRGRDGNGFALKVNGVPVFCRGAIWTTADVVRLPGDAEAYRPWLERLRDANMNMVRVPGTMVYESRAFFDLCDQLGILVWQDFMFANFDYPAADADFAAAVAKEAGQFLAQTQQSPSLAVLCGGSEVHQQATMFGLPVSATASALFDDILPAAAARLRPDVPYVVNSPSSPPGSTKLPFSVGNGVAHYFGVGAYLRPLDDARRAGVRFASECLAFANLPEPETLMRALPVPVLHHPTWKQRTPRDIGSAWDFADVRDHYLETHFGVNARDLRVADADRYAFASRAIAAEIMEKTLAEWRRCGSVTAGAIILALQDLWPGAGWGLIDSLGEPKSAWYALKRVCQPVQVMMTDEGLDGLGIHVVNETGRNLRLRLRLVCLQAGQTPVIDSEIDIDAEARSSRCISSSAMIGSFFDITRAYRFGPPGHDVAIVTLSVRETGEVLGQAFNVPSPRLGDPVPLGLGAVAERGSDGGWTLQVSSRRFARFLQISDRQFRPDDTYCHLSPLTPRRIRLHRRAGVTDDAVPDGEIVALNGTDRVDYRGS